MNLTHLIAGPAEHGVTEYALLLAEHTGGRTATPADLLPDGPVHVTFTDHLFGDTPEAAVDAVLAAVGPRPVSVSFHDVPQPGEGAERFARRAPAYRRLARAADVVVTNSQHEAAFFGTGVNVGVIPLPLPEAPALPVDAEPGTVGILGFIYPGKGHREVGAAAGGLRVRALGGFSPGHEDLDLGEIEVTGYLSDADLWREMARIHIPVCAHRHVSASGSLMRWLAAGRRVLVADSSYAREVAETFPGQVVLVRDWPAALASAADPGFAEPVTDVASWGWPEVASAWQDRWAGALTPWLRGNRPPEPADLRRGAASISVVIPHYNEPGSLTRVVRALEADPYPGEVEIIVADDGSARLPDLDSTLPLRVLTQPDEGFRAAAARNLGARAARHPVLAFLDADTVPEPGYLAAVGRWVTSDPCCVVVGTRLQDPDDAEPAWLTDAWAATDHLARADETGWRYVISSVLTLSRELFDEVGGFDATMVGYGGEDWELGFRLWNHGAIFLHDPAARARHLEPDWGARDGETADKIAEKNHESVALAQRITHPIARGHDTGIVYARQDIAVTLPPGTPEPVLAAWLRAGDVRVTAPTPELFSADPRVAPGQGRVAVTLSEPVGPPEDLPGLISRVESLGGWARVRAAGRPVGVIRAARVSTSTPAVVHTQLPDPVYPGRLERWFAGW